MSWNSVSEPGVVGYRVYYSEVYDANTESIQTTTNTTMVLGELKPSTTYKSHVTAFNFFGQESPPSERVIFHTDPRGFSIGTHALGINFTIKGEGGEGYDLLE